MRRRTQCSMAVEALRRAVLALDKGGSHGGAEASAFADFAVQCHPAIKGSWRYRAYERRLTRPAGRYRRIATAQAEALCWQRWYWYGT